LPHFLCPYIIPCFFPFVNPQIVAFLVKLYSAVFDRRG
jgi:hypothetical protein